MNACARAGLPLDQVLRVGAEICEGMEKAHRFKLGRPADHRIDSAVLNSLCSPASRRVYQHAIDQFIAWYCSEPSLAFNRIVAVRHGMHLESRGPAANTTSDNTGTKLRASDGANQCTISVGHRP
jgi:hypothetical protein